VRTLGISFGGWVDRPAEESNAAIGSRLCAGSASDESLVSRVANSEEALAELFRRYCSQVRAIAARVLSDRSEAEDLSQEIFLLLKEKSSGFDASKGSARGWILRIAYHCSISRRRYLSARSFYCQVDVEDAAREEADGRLTCASQAPIELQKTDLRKCFEVLTDNQRRTLELFFCEGYTLDEIAEELGQSKGNVRHHYFRGLEKLRKEVFCKQSQGTPA